MKLQWKKLLLCLFLPLFIGGTAGFLTRSSTQDYAMMTKPPLSPPAVVFPIVWTILYLLMGISSYLIAVSDATLQAKRDALIRYGIQLALNFLWPIVFFSLQNYVTAFLLLVLLWYAVYRMIKAFRPISPAAAYLQIPYLLWLTFAGYLNFAVILLNRF